MKKILLAFLSLLMCTCMYAQADQKASHVVIDGDGVPHYSGLAPLPDDFHAKIKAKGLYAEKSDLLFDEELPEEYSPLGELLGFIPDYSQGNYGTCYSFAGAYTIFISEAVNLSKLNHGYQYAKEMVDEYMQTQMFAPNVGITACTQWSEGGWYFEMFDNWVEKGGALLKNVKYSGSGYRQCNFLDPDIRGVEYRLLENPTNADIKRAVMKFGALAVAVHSSCLSTNSNIGACRTTSFNHAVVIVGWTKTHWIIQNSWDANTQNVFWYISQQSSPYNPTYVVVKNHVEKIVPIPEPDPDPQPDPSPNPDPQPQPDPTPVKDIIMYIAVGIFAILLIGVIIIRKKQ